MTCIHLVLVCHQWWLNGFLHVLQTSRVVSFSPLPSGDGICSEVTAIAKRFGSVKHSLFLPSRVAKLIVVQIFLFIYLFLWHVISLQSSVLHKDFVPFCRVMWRWAVQKRPTNCWSTIQPIPLKYKEKLLTFAPQLSTRRLSKPVLRILCGLIKTPFFCIWT